MKIFGFYISRTDWHYKFVMKNAWLLLREKHIAELELKLSQKTETYTGKDGRLRYKHNGQYAPDNRTKFKQTHDQLRAEVAYNKSLDYSEPQPSDTFLSGNYDEIKKASKLEEFGR